MAEGLQFAQIIADLQTLQQAVRPLSSRSSSSSSTLSLSPLPPDAITPPAPNCSQDPTTAHALLSANKTLSTSTLRRKSRASTLPDPPKFDKLGRRIVGPFPTTPSIIKDSFIGGSFKESGSEKSSGVNTPIFSPTEEPDVDIQRAKNLLQLYEMRGKFKQMGDSDLTRAKERVDKVVAGYAKRDLEEREKAARGRHGGV